MVSPPLSDKTSTTPPPSKRTRCSLSLPPPSRTHTRARTAPRAYPPCTSTYWCTHAPTHLPNCRLRELAIIPKRAADILNVRVPYCAPCRATAFCCHAVGSGAARYACKHAASICAALGFLAHFCSASTSAVGWSVRLCWASDRHRARIRGGPDALAADTGGDAEHAAADVAAVELPA